MAVDPAIIGVIGHLQSDTALVAAREYATSKLPFLTLGGSTEAMTQVGPTAFRLCATDGAIAESIGLALEKLNARKVLVVRSSTPGSELLAERIASLLSGRSTSVIGSTSVSPTERHFDSVIRELQAHEGDAVVYCGQLLQAALLESDLHDAYPSVNFIAAGDVDSSALVQLITTPARSNTVFYASKAVFEQGDAYKQFEQRYQQNYGQVPQAYSALTYDAVHLILSTADRILRDGEDINRLTVFDHLQKDTALNGVTGVLGFDKDRNRGGATAAVRVATPGIYPGPIFAEAKVGSPVLWDTGSRE